MLKVGLVIMLNNYAHIKVIKNLTLLLEYDILTLVAIKYVTGFAKTQYNHTRTEIHFIA